MKERGSHLHKGPYLEARFIIGMSYLVFWFSFISTLELLTVFSS